MKPRLAPNLQDASGSFFNAAGTEADASVSLLTSIGGEMPVADIPFHTSLAISPTPAVLSQDPASAGGQDDQVNTAEWAPGGDTTNQVTNGVPDDTAPDDSASLTRGTIAPAAAAPVYAFAALPSPSLNDPPAGPPEIQLTAASLSYGSATTETLAHADDWIFAAGSQAAGPVPGAGAAKLTTPVGTPVSSPVASLADAAHASSSPITEASVGGSGATAAQVQQALDESGLNVNGSGIKVGVLSDSFNDLGGAAADEADGALPSASNIQVLSDLSSGGTDEGRAMMQIIHDIAPGANLAFYTADNSEQDFANGILALAAAGCKVIVDDVSYYDEPFFQNGIVAQAIQTVEAEGVTYVTAAGNNAGNGYQATWTPGSGVFDGWYFPDAELFGGSLTQTITVTASSADPVPLLLEWNEAYGQASFNFGQAPDIDLFVFHNGILIGQATNASVGEPDNPWTGYQFTASGSYQIVIANNFGPDPGLIKEILAGDGLPVSISGANAGTVFGHAMTPGVITAGAVSAADTPAFGFSPTSESFSSSGAGTELLFADNGTVLSAPDQLSPVAVSGVDDIATTVPGGLSDFYGTSAASASLAGVAALILSADPYLTPAQVEQIMEDTALQMANSAVSGAGLVQVDAAIAAAEDATVVIRTDGSTSLLWSGGDYYVEVGSALREIMFGDAPVRVGEFGTYTPIGAVQTATGYDIAWQVSGTNEFTFWATDSNGNYTSNITGLLPGNSFAVESLETTFGQDFNGDGTIGFTGSLIQADGSTRLLHIANNYCMDVGGVGQELKFGGTPVTVGEFGTYTPIGAVQTATGYDIAWQITGTNEFTFWATDSNGNYTSNITGLVPGNSFAVESLETTFGQDFNGDGTIGVPSPSTFSLQYKGFDYVAFYNGAYENSDSLPSLAQTGANSIEATLDYGINVATSQVVDDPNYTDSLAALGNTIAQAESLGLSVMLRPLIDFLNPAEIAPYSVGEWRQDYQPINVAAFFASYQQMIVQEAEVAQANGAQMLSIGAELDQLTGPQYLSYWTELITAVRHVFSGELTYSASWNTASDVSFWSQLNYEGIDNYVPLSNTQNPTLQDLVNGWLDPATLSTNPGAYAVIGNQSPIAYFENLAEQSGKPLLFTELGYPNDSGAASDPSASGNSPDPTLQAELYQAFFQAWTESKSTSLVGTYFWEWDPNGSTSNVGPNIDSFSPQNSPALNQAIAGFEAVNAPAGAYLTLSDAIGPQGSATIGTGASLELAAADSGSVTFNGQTGSLILDHSSTFSGQIFNFTGNGILSGSDQIDLRDIEFGPETTVAYTGTSAGGMLTVSDAQHDTANIQLAGNYTGSTFSISSDGSGGTVVIDPPVKQDLASGTLSFNDPGSTETPTVTVSPQNDGLDYIGNFTVDAVTTGNGQDTAGWHFNFDSNPAATVTQSYDVSLDSANSTVTQSVKITIAGPGNDAFVFHPGFGADTIVNATGTDTIELDGFSSVPSRNQLALLLADAQAGLPQSLFQTANGGHDTLINLGNHDLITLANVHLANLHADNFIIG